MKYNKLNKNGFTLIELLAVIAILAIILVIAVPRVLDIQDNAKLGVAKDEAILALKSFETCVAAETSNPYTSCINKTTLGKYFDNADKATITVSGQKVTKFQYTTTNGYCVTFTDTAGEDTGSIKNAINGVSAVGTASGDVTITSGACSGS